MMRSILLFIVAPVILGLATPQAVESAELKTETFVEADGTIVLWNDYTIPPGKTFKTVVVMKGEIDFGGTTGTLVVVDGRVYLSDTARVTDKIIIHHGTISQTAGAQIPDSIQSWDKSPWWLKWESRFDHLGTAIEDFFTSAWLWDLVAIPVVAMGITICAAMVVLLGSIIFLIAPRFSQRADRVLRTSPFLSVIWGLVGFMSIVPIAIIMAISIVGVLIIPFYLLFVILIAFAGLFAGFRSLGTFLMAKVGVTNFLICTLIGLTLAFALSLLPIIGQSVFSLLWLAGVGALLRSFLINDGDPRFTEVVV